VSQKAEAVQTAIDALAAKLAVPVAHLWDVLVMQARIEAWTSLVWLPLVGAAWFAWWRVLAWARKNHTESQDRFSDWGIIATLVGLVGAIALTVSSVQALALAAGSIGYLINPEYYAVKQILGALK
jgi:hypothetical protein